MSWLGMALVFFGALIIAAPLGWMGLNKLQRLSDDRYRQQQRKRELKH